MDWKSIRIEQGDSLPYYMQLAREIRRLILTGRIPLGERIPVSRELMKIFKFSSTTVEKGIGILVEEGFLVRRPRIGTFVAETLPVKPRRQRKHSGKVKVLFTDIFPYGDFWFQILFELERGLSELGCELVFLRRENSAVIDPKELASDCLGVVMCGTNSLRLAREVQAYKTPLVLIGGLDHDVSHEFGLDLLMHDDAETCYCGIKHLLALGHRGIAVLAPCVDSQFGSCQRVGIEKAMREFGLTEKEIHIIECESISVESGEELTREVVSTYPDTTAIFVIDAPMAAGCLRAAAQLGISVPQELSVLTVDSRWFCSIVNPALTALAAYDETQIARHALEKLFGQINTPGYHKCVTRLQRGNKIIFRNSVHAFRRSDPQSFL
ncbi:GntR family transcriptional regulator [uncultured Victivallis sp.]|uniref:GntR family transcriptional regulator n=1 Tax=uncultured Victivallis sp. TaxID=354118 RepID=UPI00259312CD|nr:GntR family transcriptional regulator [uncultured Victivallis sp.]